MFYYIIAWVSMLQCPIEDDDHGDAVPIGIYHLRPNDFCNDQLASEPPIMERRRTCTQSLKA